MTEDKISKAIQKHAQNDGFKVWSFERCNIPFIPDLYCTLYGSGSFWIEIKCVKNSKQQIPFRPGQQQWLREHREAGGLAFVLVYEEKTNDFYLLPSEIIDVTRPFNLEIALKGKLTIFYLFSFNSLKTLSCILLMHFTNTGKRAGFF